MRLRMCVTLPISHTMIKQDRMETSMMVQFKGVVGEPLNCNIDDKVLLRVPYCFFIIRVDEASELKTGITNNVCA